MPICADRFTILQQGEKKVQLGCATCIFLTKKKQCQRDCVLSVWRTARRVDWGNRSELVELQCLVSLSPRDFNLLSWRPEVNQQKRLLMTLTWLIYFSYFCPLFSSYLLFCHSLCICGPFVCIFFCSLYRIFCFASPSVFPPFPQLLPLILFSPSPFPPSCQRLMYVQESVCFKSHFTVSPSQIPAR